jgi:hypothetical protein
VQRFRGRTRAFDRALKEQLSATQVLERLLEVEETRARDPVHKTLTEFDFRPSLDRKVIAELSTSASSRSDATSSCSDHQVSERGPADPLDRCRGRAERHPFAPNLKRPEIAEVAERLSVLRELGWPAPLRVRMRTNTSSGSADPGPA